MVKIMMMMKKSKENTWNLLMSEILLVIMDTFSNNDLH